ncbi:MAG TPA: Gfo/Idh/MocA family oxidoreductase [Puia sp.]|nr:Gfo/Idh/MocA family oxidoreductase [Puia sp.]
MKKIRWGILGCGNIAKKMASDLQYVEGAELVACGSRSQSVADEFANKFSISHSHGSYEALVNDKDVDVIYVASPHGLHYEHVLLCLKSKKAVLCEKAFAINSRQANEMISEARKQNVFLMEALWSKFTPQHDIVQQIIKNGDLGEIQSMIVNFGFIPEPPFSARLFEPSLGGGSLLDIGIYNVFYALSVLGRPDIIEASMTPATTGVDEQCAATFRYSDGRIAQLFSTFSSNLATEADINGRKGRLRLTPRFYNPTTATIEFYPGKIDSKQIIPHHSEPGFGYQYQAKHVCDCLRQGITESPVMTHADTLLIMETMDRIRSIAGIHYEVD